MIIETIVNNHRYTLSNSGLKVGDTVYPIASGRCTGGDGWVLNNFDFRDGDFINLAQKILDLKYSDYKPYQIRTTAGYGPIECYYKIIKDEIQVDDPQFENSMFKAKIWEEVK